MMKATMFLPNGWRFRMKLKRGQAISETRTNGRSSRMMEEKRLNLKKMTHSSASQSTLCALTVELITR